MAASSTSSSTSSTRVMASQLQRMVTRQMIRAGGEPLPPFTPLYPALQTASAALRDWQIARDTLDTLPGPVLSCSKGRAHPLAPIAGRSDTVRRDAKQRDPF